MYNIIYLSDPMETLKTKAYLEFMHTNNFEILLFL